MRFYTWNVNGFRAALKKGFMDWLEEADPDVISLQEIRCEWEEVDLGVRRQIESAYEVCWFPAKSKKGYAGSATLSRKELGFTHTPGLGIPAFRVACRAPGSSARARLSRTGTRSGKRLRQELLRGSPNSRFTPLRANP